MFDLSNKINGLKNNMCLDGMTDDFFALFVSEMFKKKNENIVVVTSTLYEANKLFKLLNSYTASCHLFPMDDFLTSESIAISPELKITRLETINKLLSHKSIVVTHLNGYLRFLPEKNIYTEKILNLKVGEQIDRDELIRKLYSLGYHKEVIVSQTGEFGIRGYIVDIFGLSEEYPIRLEFFDDEIESIRYFDETTQKSIKSINEIKIFPNTEFLTNNDVEITGQKYLEKYSNKVTNILGYMNNPLVFFKDMSQIKANYKKMMLDIMDYRNQKEPDYDGRYMFELDEFLLRNEYYYNTLDFSSNSNSLYFDIKRPPVFNENIDDINDYIKKELLIGHTLVVCLTKRQIKRFINELKHSYAITDIDHLENNQVNIINLNIDSGFIYESYVFLGQKEIFNEKVESNKYKTNYKYSTKIKSIDSINIGDYVVHNAHGIGIYNGIKTLERDKILKDYIEILYSGKDKLYIPVEKIEYISKFSSKEGLVPKVNKLGGTEWAKTKLRVRKKIQDIADKLIKLYAQREVMQGYAFSNDNELQLMFEEKFPYQLTIDQANAVNQIKKDMELSKPMDRLLCGDVGYGKTEVAFRAMFKAVSDSKQVLYLCPTTILANQQFNNAIERFKGFPVEIKVLNRFVSKKAADKIVSAFNNGEIDILFGTHRVLSKDIKPKDLGLLVIDEEHKFGVLHKEKIKEYKENVDVLTLTATPIPRTLQMSLIGIRSLSLIETPPKNRYPVQTYVMDENDAIIRDAIYKEMSRDGQVFILYNNVKNIERKVNKIQKLVPDAKIEYAHGQLSKNDLENRMLDFIDHKYDVLVCTTIIENGIDIPNVNTLIVLEADKLGLSQLYQIRGRVGRSNKIAYCYLMYNGNKVLTETAIKRLNVIKEFTELGSGFSIATRDLSIRGAGDVLGSEQAGFIDNIGIDLYLKILDEEVKRLKGEEIEEEAIDEKPLLEVSTHISDEYIFDDDLKIEIHKRINEIDSMEKLNAVKLELEDRFGKISDDIIIYMHEELFEKIAKRLEIIDVRQTKNFIELVFSEEMTEKIDGEQLFIDAFSVSSMFRFKTKNKCLIIILDTIKLDRHYIYILIDLLSKIKLKTV